MYVAKKGRTKSKIYMPYDAVLVCEPGLAEPNVVAFIV
jgi:hypothetical protein